MHITPGSGTNPQHPPQHTSARVTQVSNRSLSPKIPRTDATPPKAFDSDSLSRSIVIFGETGVGKSSIINMLHAEEVATTSNSANGCTAGSSDHEVTLASPSGTKKYRLWDTSGLNEGDKGTVPAQQAIANLVALVKELSANKSGDGGVSLLVYCIRGTRLREIIRVNYDLFWGIICNGQVPIVLVITGLENEDNMDNWWRDNRAELEGVMGLRFDGHACVTSTRGKLNKSGRYMYEEEYQESVRKVRNLLESACTLRAESMKIEGERGIAEIGMRLQHYMSEYNQRTGKERHAGERSRNGGPSQSQDPGHYMSEYHQQSGQQRPVEGFLQLLQLLRDLLAPVLRFSRPRAQLTSGTVHRHDQQPPPYHTDSSSGSRRDPEQLVAKAPDRHSLNRRRTSNSSSATPTAYQ